MSFSKESKCGRFLLMSGGAMFYSTLVGNSNIHPNPALFQRLRRERFKAGFTIPGRGEGLNSTKHLSKSYP